MQKKTKLIHLIGSLSKGGAERFVVDLCNELAKDEQYEVCLVSICANDSEDSFIKDIHQNVKYFSFGKGKGFSLRTFLTLTMWLYNEKPHLVHSHLSSFEYLGLYLLFNRNTLFLHTIHATAQAECPNLFIKAFRKIWYKSNRVKPVTISYDGSKTYREYYRLDNDVLIQNGRPDLILTDEHQQLVMKYRSNSDSFLLVHVGRIAIEKNQELLIRAVQQFNAAEEKKCKLLVIGEVREEPLYEKLIRIVNNDPLIEFVGGKHNVADYLKIADAFCLSSIFEGMPISLIEALSIGCIPICTPVGGIKQMISHGNTGFLSADGGVDNYSLTIKEALFHQNKETIKLNCRLAFRQKYHISVSSGVHSETYSSMMAASKKSGQHYSADRDIPVFSTEGR